MSKASEEIAKRTVDTLKTTGDYEDKTGKYRKSFKIKKEPSLTGVKNIVYSTRPSLTHLLEKGHATARGTKRTRAFPHWAPAETQAINSFEAELKKNIGEIK